MSSHHMDHTAPLRTPHQSVLAGGGPEGVFMLFCLLGSPSVDVRARALCLLLAAIRPQIVARTTAWIADTGIVSPSHDVIVTQVLWELRDALASGKCRARSLRDMQAFLDRRVRWFLEEYQEWRSTAPCRAPCQLSNVDPLVLLPRGYRHALLFSLAERVPEASYDLLMRAQLPTRSLAVRRGARRDGVLQSLLTEARAAFAEALLDAVDRELALAMARDPLPLAA